MKQNKEIIFRFNFNRSLEISHKILLAYFELSVFEKKFSLLSNKDYNELFSIYTTACMKELSVAVRKME